jgi:hypothetical protein
LGTLVSGGTLTGHLTHAAVPDAVGESHLGGRGPLCHAAATTIGLSVIKRCLCAISVSSLSDVSNLEPSLYGLKRLSDSHFGCQSIPTYSHDVPMYGIFTLFLMPALDWALSIPLQGCFVNWIARVLCQFYCKVALPPADGEGTLLSKGAADDKPCLTRDLTTRGLRAKKRKKKRGGTACDCILGKN